MANKIKHHRRSRSSSASSSMSADSAKSDVSTDSGPPSSSSKHKSPHASQKKIRNLNKKIVKLQATLSYTKRQHKRTERKLAEKEVECEQLQEELDHRRQTGRPATSTVALLNKELDQERHEKAQLVEALEQAKHDLQQATTSANDALQMDDLHKHVRFFKANSERNAQEVRRLTMEKKQLTEALEVATETVRYEQAMNGALKGQDGAEAIEVD